LSVDEDILAFFGFWLLFEKLDEFFLNNLIALGSNKRLERLSLP
jgi:hypothetical protein